VDPFQILDLPLPGTRGQTALEDLGTRLELQLLKMKRNMFASSEKGVLKNAVSAFLFVYFLIMIG
jgi:hypothetical protein